jgi:hypothetical protein
MKNYENLNGALVLVRPDFTDDPARQQGKVGVVTYASEVDDIYVGLLNGAEGHYHGKDLLMLKEKTEIMKELATHDPGLDMDDFKALYKIYMLQDRGNSTALVNALEIAAQRPAIWDKAMVTAAPDRELELTKSYGR